MVVGKAKKASVEIDQGILLDVSTKFNYSTVEVFEKVNNLLQY